MTAPSPAQPSDRRLLVAAQRGDATALGTLIERHFGLIHAVARARLRRPEAAEDLVQEVALRALLNIQRLDPRGNIPAYLARMTRNLAIDWLRRGQTASRLLPMVDLGEQDVADLPDSTRKGARDAMATQQEIDALHQALDAMPPDDRELVLLHHAEGLSQRDIAQRLGMNQATVSRRMQRALGHLRGRLEPTLRQAAPALRAPRPAAQRTVAMLAVAATLSASAKGSLAAAAAASEPAGLFVAGKFGGVGLLSTLAANAATGGTLMSAGKVTVGLAAAGIIGFFGFKAIQPERQPDLSEAISTTAVKPAVRDAEANLWTLANDYVPGQRWAGTSTVDMDINVVIPGAPVPAMHFEIDIAGSSTLQVNEIQPGGVTVTEEINNPFTTTTSTMNGEPFDWAAESGFDFAEAFSEMRTRITSDRNGNIIDLDIQADALPTNDYFVQEVAIALMSGLPDQAVAPGDSWTRDIQITSIPGFRASCLSTLERIDEVNGEQVAVISRSAEIRVPHALPMDENTGQQVLSVSGRVWGEETIHLSDGTPIGYRVNWDLQMPTLGTNQTPAGSVTYRADVHQQIVVAADYAPLDPAPPAKL